MDYWKFYSTRTFILVYCSDLGITRSIPPPFSIPPFECGILKFASYSKIAKNDKFEKGNPYAFLSKIPKIDQFQKGLPLICFFIEKWPKMTNLKRVYPLLFYRKIASCFLYNKSIGGTRFKFVNLGYFFDKKAQGIPFQNLSIFAIFW